MLMVSIKVGRPPPHATYSCVRNTQNVLIFLVGGADDDDDVASLHDQVFDHQENGFPQPLFGLQDDVAMAHGLVNGG